MIGPFASDIFLFSCFEEIVIFSVKAPTAYELTKYFNKFRFANAFATTMNDDGSLRIMWLLKHLGDKSHVPHKIRFMFRANYVLPIFKKWRNIAFDRLNGKVSPKVIRFGGAVIASFD